MTQKMLSAIALVALLATGCAATTPVAAPSAAPAATASDNALYAISDADLAALSDAQFSALSDKQIAALSPTQIAGLSQARLAAMTPGQRGALLVAQFSTLSIAQQKALPVALIAALTPAQLQTLTPVQAEALTAEQLAGLSAEQLAAVATAKAAPEDASGPDRAIPTGPRTPGLYVQVLDGMINLTNQGGTQNFAAGQFGFVSGMATPPVVLPPKPGVQFNPPAINGPSGPSTSTKPGLIDCEVRYAVNQATPAPTPTSSSPPTKSFCN